MISWIYIYTYIFRSKLASFLCSSVYSWNQHPVCLPCCKSQGDLCSFPFTITHIWMHTKILVTFCIISASSPVSLLPLHWALPFQSLWGTYLMYSCQVRSFWSSALTYTLLLRNLQWFLLPIEDVPNYLSLHTRTFPFGSVELCILYNLARQNSDPCFDLLDCSFCFELNVCGQYSQHDLLNQDIWVLNVKS